ncbi:response regulator [Marispirochaeta aestuarii]|uniref:response regulator n=1 Tax=Marispirochaeta aestuarii TaxID=1963862 RepID=UPI0029C8E588|nr:response regulator [Marispirochaeta aestuarii]
MECSRILIVDDSATSRMIIRRCFQIAGYGEIQYLEAEDGLAALSLLQKERVDLIVSDIKMPKMDGTTLVRKLRLNRDIGDIPVVIISSVGNEALEEQLRESAVKAIIKKPVSPAKILSFMEE